MNRSVIVALIAVIVLGVGGYLVFHKSSPNNAGRPSSQPATNSSTTTQTTPAAQSADNASTASTITYTNSGFSPATLTVKAGTKVTIKNNSSGELEFSSDDHPTHTKDPELNTQTIGPGQSTTVTPTTTGTHGYHNHINASDTGTIIVQ